MRCCTAFVLGLRQSLLTFTLQMWDAHETKSCMYKCAAEHTYSCRQMSFNCNAFCTIHVCTVIMLQCPLVMHPKCKFTVCLVQKEKMSALFELKFIFKTILHVFDENFFPPDESVYQIYTQNALIHQVFKQKWTFWVSKSQNSNYLRACFRLTSVFKWNKLLSWVLLVHLLCDDVCCM